MGKTYRKKRWWIRLRNGMSYTIFSTSIVGCVALGFLLGFIAFAQPSDVSLPVTRGMQIVVAALEGVMQRSTWGEWASAFAAGLVGIGAYKYAKEAHEHRVQETNEAFNRDLKERKTRLWFVYLTVLRCNRARTSYISFLKLPTTGQSPQLLKRCLETATRKTREIVFNDIDRGVIPDECLADYAMFVTKLETSSDNFEVLAKNVDLNGTTPLSGSNLTRFTTFQTNADDLAEEGQKLKRGLQAARRALKFRRIDAGLR